MVSILNDLFIAFFKVGLLSFGGGYTLIPLIQQQVVEVNKWATQDEFLKVLGASQAIPGAISIKFATYIGYKEAGLLGVVISIIGSLIVPIAAILVLFNVLKVVDTFPVADRALKGIKGATWGLIIGFGINAFTSTNYAETRNIFIGVAALVAVTFFKVSPALIIVISGIAGLIFYK